jgi:hypothetical protein
MVAKIVTQLQREYLDATREAGIAALQPSVEWLLTFIEPRALFSLVSARNTVDVISALLKSVGSEDVTKDARIVDLLRDTLPIPQPPPLGMPKLARERADHYLARRLAPSTLRSYNLNVERWQVYCRITGYNPLSPLAVEVASFIATFSDRQSYGRVLGVAAALRMFWRAMGCVDATESLEVRNLLAALARRREPPVRARKPYRPLYEEDLRRMLVALCTQ